MLKKLLIANRGEIACRIIRSAKKLGIRSVAVCSDEDRMALHVQLADEFVCLGGASALENYLDMEAILNAALQSGADSVHPGYGFLAENAAFAKLLNDAGLVFVGPSSDVIQSMGSKIESKKLVEQAGVPVVPGYNGANQEASILEDEAGKIGYPIIIKASAGGGGRGMRLVNSASEFKAQLDSAKLEARQAFSDDTVLLEKYLAKARHIEVQILADSYGNIVHLFERDCSMQRRHQKVLEEAPAPNISNEFRQHICQAAIDISRSVNYEGAGTVEFICDKSSFYFMEMNTRLQVEHPISEAITGIDLVDWQLRIAAGEKLDIAQTDIKISGHALEARLYAENPKKNFMPSAGTLITLSIPAEVRVDTGVASGSEVSRYYDPMIAKIIAHADSRESALEKMLGAIEKTRVAGVEHNLVFLKNLLNHTAMHEGNYDTGFIEREIAELIPPTATYDLLLGMVWKLLALTQPLPWGGKTGFRINMNNSQHFNISADSKIFDVVVTRNVEQPDSFGIKIDSVYFEVREARWQGTSVSGYFNDKKVRGDIAESGGKVIVMRSGGSQTMRIYDPLKQINRNVT